MKPKVTYRLGVYSKMIKAQEGKIWKTRFTTLTRKEVHHFHEQRGKGDFVMVGDTVESLLQKELYNTSSI